MSRGKAWRSVFAAASLATVTLAAISCRQILGIEDREVGGFVYVSAECESCVASACAAEEAACLAEEACTTRYRCLAACGSGDAACRQPCIAQTSATEASNALDVCRSQRCLSVCDACAGSMFDPRSSECSTCMMANCCEEASTCAAERDCSAAVRAWLRCTDPVCAGGALLEAVRALPTGLDVHQCRAHCLSACHMGTDWSCVEAYLSPEPTKAQVTVTLKAIDALTNVGIDGLTIVACVDEACEPDPSRTTVTIGGQAELKLPNPFTGDFHLSHEGYIEERWYIGKPLVDDAALRFPLFTVGLEQILANMLGTTLDEERGLVIVTAFDCFDDFAIGASIQLSSADANTVTGYFVGSAVSAEASATVDVGSAIFANVPAGETVATIQSPAGVPVGISNGNVRAGFRKITRIWVYPWQVE